VVHPSGFCSEAVNDLPVRPLVSASRATGRLFINIFSGRFLFFGLVAARFTTPVESFSVFNFLH
jgi:hypothetical protein